MKTKNEIIDIIFKSIDEINEQNGTNILKNLDTKLFGKESDLDSFGLVNLIVSIEENINYNFNVSISIADEKAMSQKNSPFKSVNTLADYTTELINEIIINATNK